nr:hypothetical protein [Escherichia marmotae]
MVFAYHRTQYGARGRRQPPCRIMLVARVTLTAQASPLRDARRLSQRIRDVNQPSVPSG